MDQSTMQWTREAINNIQSNLTVRIREGNLSNRDQQMMANMMAEIQKELENQTAANEAVRELYENLGRIQEELTAPITREVADRIEVTAAAAGRNLDELEKVNHIANALQLDAQSIIPLLEQLQQKQNEMRQSFQKAVDIDFQLYGKTSSLTERALEAYHFEITPDRQVIEAVTKETEEPAKDHSSKQAEPEIKKSPAAFSEKRELYQEGDRIKLKIPNVTPEEKKAIENQLFQAGARYYKGTIPAEESNTGKEVNYTSWYVKYTEGMDLSPFASYIKGRQSQAQKETTGNAPAPAQEAAAISAAVQAPPAASSGKEPYQAGDRIKLKIPNVTPEEKKAIENQLFQAGARYYKGTIPAEESNTGKEVNYTSWYVKYKEGMDLSAFSPYIKGKQQQKPSVLKQLDKNKKQAGEGKEKLPEEMEKKSPEMER